nr:PREDICTED: testis- and ovary-specific PAZ domain-containing protein 1 isoform X2 [Latimeria chalumnae]|eukprot:XP_014346637.1 PREDICTED: testis- and ovary-specific PAZ domain-containing protein 1 isoform X2 [Latimeria chalumnae]
MPQLRPRKKVLSRNLPSLVMPSEEVSGRSRTSSSQGLGDGVVLENKTNKQSLAEKRLRSKEMGRGIPEKSVAEPSRKQVVLVTGEAGERKTVKKGPCALAQQNSQAKEGDGVEASANQRHGHPEEQSLLPQDSRRGMVEIAEEGKSSLEQENDGDAVELNRQVMSSQTGGGGGGLDENIQVNGNLKMSEKEMEVRSSTSQIKAQRKKDGVMQENKGKGIYVLQDPQVKVANSREVREVEQNSLSEWTSEAVEEEDGKRDLAERKASTTTACKMKLRSSTIKERAKPEKPSLTQERDCAAAGGDTLVDYSSKNLPADCSVFCDELNGVPLLHNQTETLNTKKSNVKTPSPRKIILCLKRVNPKDATEISRCNLAKKVSEGYEEHQGVEDCPNCKIKKNPVVNLSNCSSVKDFLQSSLDDVRENYTVVGIVPETDSRSEKSKGQRKKRKEELFCTDKHDTSNEGLKNSCPVESQDVSMETNGDPIAEQKANAAAAETIDQSVPAQSSNTSGFLSKPNGQIKRSKRAGLRRKSRKRIKVQPELSRELTSENKTLNISDQQNHEVELMESQRELGHQQTIEDSSGLIAHTNMIAVSPEVLNIRERELLCRLENHTFMLSNETMDHHGFSSDKLHDKNKFADTVEKAPEQLELNETGKDLHGATLLGKDTEQEDCTTQNTLASGVVHVDGSGNIPSLLDCSHSDYGVKGSAHADDPEQSKSVSCRRIAPLTGKREWPIFSCARTLIVWPFQKHSSLLRPTSHASHSAAFESTSKDTAGNAVFIGFENEVVALESVAVPFQAGAGAILHSSLTEVLKETSNWCEKKPLIKEAGSNRGYSAVHNVRASQMGRRCLLTNGKLGKHRGGNDLGKIHASVSLQNSPLNSWSRTDDKNESISDVNNSKGTSKLKHYRIPLCKNKVNMGQVDSASIGLCSPLERHGAFSTSVTQQKEQIEESPHLKSNDCPLFQRQINANTRPFLKPSGHMSGVCPKENFSQMVRTTANLDVGMSLAVSEKPSADWLSEEGGAVAADVAHVEESQKPATENELDSSCGVERENEVSKKSPRRQEVKECAQAAVKAYEEDVLLLDVIQDDPELFGSPSENRSVAGSMEDSWDCTDVEEQTVVVPSSSDITGGTAKEAYKICLSKSLHQSAHSTPVELPRMWHRSPLKDEFKAEKFSSKSSSSAGDDEGQFKDFDEHRAYFPLVDQLDTPDKVMAVKKSDRMNYGDTGSSDGSESNWTLNRMDDSLKGLPSLLPTPVSLTVHPEIAQPASVCSVNAEIFIGYYRSVPPGIQFDSDVMNDLLLGMAKKNWLQFVFELMNVCLLVKILPAKDILLNVFGCVASIGSRNVVPSLIDITCKCVEAGLTLQTEHFDYIIKLLGQLQASWQEIDVVMAIKSRLQKRKAKKDGLCDITAAVAEVKHYREKGDWAKIGTLYSNLRSGCEDLGELNKLSSYVAVTLMKDVKADQTVVPFCEFARAVHQNPHFNGLDKNLLGRIGISVMLAYSNKKKWMKGRKVLDALHEMQIHFTTLKGLVCVEGFTSRCQIVNIAVEIFLNTGSLDGAMWVLKESEWTINTVLYPCSRMDVLKRHNLLCAIANRTLAKSLYDQTFEVLRNLPGLQESQDTVDVSQYSVIFNKLLEACIENRTLGVSSSVVEFMASKNIPINFVELRALITALGRNCLWLKARSHYKNALSMGCYPPLEGNLYCRLLSIPCYLSEIEMLLALEVFIVANASNIQSPCASSPKLQIVLKRYREDRGCKRKDYKTAVKRMMAAARISNPKLLVKLMTVNVAMEQVFTLDQGSAQKWLKENMKWAAKVWLFQ